MTGAKLTAEQRESLALMRDGWKLRNHGAGWHLHWEEPYKHVSTKCPEAEAMAAAGLVSAVEHSRSFEYVLTPAGRAALEAQP